MKRVLIVDGDSQVSDALQSTLSGGGYQCTCVSDGAQAVNLMGGSGYDAVVTEMSVSGVGGFELLDYIRYVKIPAVIVIGSRSDSRTRIRALRAGADDYVQKPLDPEEVMVRLEKILSRRPSAGQSKKQTIEYDEYTVDLAERAVFANEKRVELTPKEIGMFIALLTNRGVTLQRESLFREVWDAEFDGSTRTLDLHAQRLRHKLGLGERLKSVYKVGYRLD